ncbi:MAG TPA: HAMP domain-containing sensor histidine kinase [Solirubrobacterales bacterium]|nr:HAMP domain-containing sensor histidine kinase [Solirubrobacterales bacterium]
MEPRRPVSGLSSVRTRLVLLSFAITATAIAFVYLYVVPQLSSRLESDRLERLEQQGGEELDLLRSAARRGLEQRELAALVRRTAADVDSRITLLGLREGEPAFVIADSELESEALDPDYPAASGAAAANEVRSATETVGGSRIGEAAFPVGGAIPGGEGGGGAAASAAPGWVIVLSTPLDDVEANVALIRDRTLTAGGIALVLSLIAAYIAAGYHARRLRRLEAAAERVADGDFSAPIPAGASDEVGQLAETLDLMRRRLRGLETARRDFIANASHELRTPIASLGGFVELLADDPEPDAEARREFVRTMRGQIERLTKLATDLLDLSRLDADALSLHSELVDLTGLAGEVAVEFAAAAERHDATVQVAPGAGDPHAQADRARTAQILRILVDNALKHTAPGTEIAISPSSTAAEARVTVTDDGPGIDPRSRDRIFDRFYTADSVSGSGLGLAIARELARAMGGDVILDPRRGRGASFSLILPPAGAAHGSRRGGHLGAPA